MTSLPLSRLVSRAFPLTAALLTLFPAFAAHAATAPIDWRLAVDVSPITDESGPTVHPTVEDRLRLLVSFDSVDCLDLSFERPVVDGSTIRIQTRRTSTNIEPCSLGRGSRFTQQLTVEPLGEPGSYTIQVYDEELLVLSRRLEVWGPMRSLVLRGGILETRYIVEMKVFLTDPRVVADGARQASAVILTPQSGYFWFFDPDNVEVTVQVLDGRAVNGQLWLFVTGMTDLGVTVEARVWGSCSGAPCPTHRYVNRPGKHLVVVDGIAAAD